ncbi:RAS oncogene family member Rab21 isoform X2 [Lasioglossum baleicum]|uniref:RAS oncogene family member Rab21 isoform X2 n=1 Tax=Lasioglossum baleicum TaxID=434251 RepID=UPI003FCC4543
MASLISTTGNDYNFKVVLLGEGCVGKTSVALRYVEDKFNDRHISTLQASFLNKKLTINGKKVNLAIWDTAGQEKFHALGPIYYRMSNGAILVYDITDEDTFQKVKNWVKELKKMLGSEISLAIAGNKMDLEKDRSVAIEEAEELPRKEELCRAHSACHGLVQLWLYEYAGQKSILFRGQTTEVSMISNLSLTETVLHTICSCLGVVKADDSF